MHPDEQVVVALLGSSHISALRKRARAVVSGLVKKAVRETRMRGELWTSVMDALWGADELRTFRTSPSLDRHGIATVLGQWIQAQDDPAALRALVAQTRSEELVRYIAKEAPVVDLALMDAVFTASPNYAAQDLAGNHHLSAALREALLDRIATIAARGGESSMAGLSMRNAYTALLQQGLAFRPEHLERLNSASERHRKARTDSWKRECKRILAFFELHVQATGDEDLAFRIIEHARDMPGGRLWGLRLLQKAGGPESRLEVTRRLARAVVELWGDNRIVLENVARHAEARRDQDIRKRLLDSRSLKVYVELAKDPRPEDFRFLFERLVRSRPEASLQMAREAGGHRAPGALSCRPAPAASIRVAGCPPEGDFHRGNAPRESGAVRPEEHEETSGFLNDPVPDRGRPDPERRPGLTENAPFRRRSVGRRVSPASCRAG